MKIRFPKLSRKAWVVMDIVVVATILIVVGFFAFRAEKTSSDTVKIPESISKDLLFTPYAASTLPKGYQIDKDSFKTQETALIFTASNHSGGGQLVFSEQSVPKDLSMDEFHSNAITNPERLEGLKFRTIFGKLQGREGTLASVVTDDNTWILVTMPKDATKETATAISQGLIRQ